MNFWFYSAFGVLFFSGVIWLIVRYLLDQGGFEEQDYSLEPWLLKIHGAAAMTALIILGVLIPSHIQRGWAQQRNRITAFVIVSVCLLMIVSGYGLYYCDSEQFRAWISGFHSVAGCLLPLVLIWHILSSRKDKVRGHSS